LSKATKERMEIAMQNQGEKLKEDLGHGHGLAAWERAGNKVREMTGWGLGEQIMLNLEGQEVSWEAIGGY
jgi:histone acetyltransferase (RNA polymerase elongator complex component)